MVFNPYTLDDDAKITLGTGFVLTISSNRVTNPATFECTYAPGFFTAYLTPACAARCNTIVTLHVSNTVRTVVASFKSASTTCTPISFNFFIRARFNPLG